VAGVETMTREITSVLISAIRTKKPLVDGTKDFEFMVPLPSQGSASVVSYQLSVASTDD
jgi:hypothetical protein